MFGKGGRGTAHARGRGVDDECDRVLLVLLQRDILALQILHGEGVEGCGRDSRRSGSGRHHATPARCQHGGHTQQCGDGADHHSGQPDQGGEGAAKDDEQANSALRGILTGGPPRPFPLMNREIHVKDGEEGRRRVSRLATAERYPTHLVFASKSKQRGRREENQDTLTHTCICATQCKEARGGSMRHAQGHDVNQLTSPTCDCPPPPPRLHVRAVPRGPPGEPRHARR